MFKRHKLKSAEQVLKEQDFPGSREYLGTVCGQREYKVFMPNMRDFKIAQKLCEEPETKDAYCYVLSAMSVGLSYQEFMEISASDGAEILTLVSNAMKALKPLVQKGEITKQ